MDGLIDWSIACLIERLIDRFMDQLIDVTGRRHTQNQLPERAILEAGPRNAENQPQGAS